MDICTLVIVTSMTTQACYSKVTCVDDAEHNRRICSGGFPNACPMPEPFYECKRVDGTTYMLKQSEVK